MRLLEINTVCGIRSTGRICAAIAQEYKDNGYDVRMAYGREDVPERERDSAVQIGDRYSSMMYAAMCRVFDNDGFAAKAQTRKFLRWAQEFDPDVLWMHNLHGYYINVELLFDWIKSRPQMKVYWTLHDCWAFTGHCSHFTMIGCERWRTQCERCPQKGGYPKSMVLDNSKRNFKRKKAAFCGVKDMTIVTPSAWLADLVKQSFLGDYPVEVHHNTIDTTVFCPTPGRFREEHGLQDKRIVLGVASAWSKSKGLDEFVKLSQMLDDRFKVVLVGLTPEQRRGLPPEILVIERTNNVQQLAEIYTAADVFANPSKQETFGLTTLEALSCGTKAIVYKDTACEEVAALYGGIVIEQTTQALYDAVMAATED